MSLLPWPGWSRLPPDWNQEFFFYHGWYQFDPIFGRTLFCIGGVTHADNTILLELFGHHPRCYFKSDCDLDAARALVSHWERRAKDTAASYFGSNRWTYDQIANVPRWVMSVSARICEDMVEDRPAERVGVRYCVEFAHPCLVKMFREYVLYYAGSERDPRIPTWCDGGGDRRTFSRMLVYEANVDYVERVIADRQFPPSVWYKLLGRDFKLIRATSCPTTYDETGKRYDVVVRANINMIQRR